MYFLNCVFVLLASAVYCTTASLRPFHFNPFQLNAASNNAETTTKPHSTTTEYFENYEPNSPQFLEAPQTSYSSDGQVKINELPEALMTPLHILQLLLGYHNSHPNFDLRGMDTPNMEQSESHPQELLPGLPITSLAELPNLLSRSLKLSPSQQVNPEEKSFNISKN